ncbi:hypothetical protein HN51_054459 [Arachis hypogaea]|uniref:Uncharacterized protein n=1 Tax=Arachis hypogaea TaxID=3818 RepID=A0A6B9V6Q7_ARAHY|nr:transcription factor MYB108-like [Arachis ipaensis]XP_025679754.1 transcription factor MYB108 [Arachis hypogaea]QHN77023.1 uncharacterized protein DS421_19g649070 [Arachis hypogaea]
MEMEYTSSVHMIMRSLSDCGSSVTNGSEEDMEIRKGPWTEEEDSALLNHITTYGEGHWNSVARSAGLKRSGKSCRLRWLNYLRPNVRRGNITLEEQLLILDLHSRWGNRWSKIAEQLPGRTDNEIKNYWRTRVVKQAKQLKCDVNSKQFRDALRYVWMPRLIEQIQAQGRSTMCVSQAREIVNPVTSVSMASSKSCSSFSGCEQFQASSSVSDSCVSYYSLMGSGSGGGSSEHAEKGATSSSTPFEPENGFGGADLWTDENIWFLQQQLADDDHL